MRLIQASLVLTGEGFTPQNFNGAALADLFGAEPAGVIASPILTLVDFVGGYQVNVQRERFEIRHDSPGDDPHDERLEAAFTRAIALWPLVQPTGLGLNFIFAQPFAGELTRDTAFDVFLRRDVLSGVVFQAPLNSSQHIFVFEADGRPVTLKTGDVALPAGPGVAIDCNVHYQPVAAVPDVLARRVEWYDRCRIWGDRLVGIHG
jgi:hypothetical protein